MIINKLYQLFLDFPQISTDSRNIKPGSIFFALKGENFDGNKYAVDSLSNGAQYAVVDDVTLKEIQGCIYVENVLKTLQDLANFHRRKLGLKIISITGTNGKTTTKELIYAVLKQRFNVIATQGNLNNHIGVPLTLLSMNSDTEIGIVEMGANHVGEIELLSKIADPDFGIITNVGKAHLEGFGSFEGVVKAKTELYKYIESKKGSIFINIDHAILSTAVNNLTCSKITYGIKSNDHFYGEVIALNPFLSALLTKVSGNNIESTTIQTKLVGSYNIENIVAAACIGSYFNIPFNKINEAISDYTPSNNRSQLLKLGSNELLLDYYNANPTSMDVAVRNFKDISTDLTKVIVLGEMLELGEQSEEEHEKLIHTVSLLGFQNVLLVGNSFNEIGNKAFKVFIDVYELSAYLKSKKFEKCFVLLKGSRGVKLEKCIEFFDN
jgi:UDP-N-acetylmuramoyl-tripeptide--D-alanyl-D-alanine ligase